MARKLTVTAQFRPLKKGFKIVPLIRLAGNWLEDAGLKPGAKVHVTIEDGTITIHGV